jgi:hypothetical protein
VSLRGDINNTVLELGLTFLGPDPVPRGGLLFFRISDRSRGGQYDPDQMAEAVLQLLRTSPFENVRKVAENAEGVFVE